MNADGCGAPLCDLHLTWEKMGIRSTSAGDIPREAIEAVIHFPGGHRVKFVNEEVPFTVLLCGTIRRPATP